VSNCSRVTNTDIISATYLKQADSILSSNDKIINSLFFKSKTGTYIVDIKHYSTGNVLSISGRLAGQNYGHHFIMTARKTLDSYLFNVGDGMHNSYSIKLAKKDKYSELGDPLVDYMMDQSCAGLNDSLKCLYLLFSSFPRKKLKASVSFDDIRYQSLELKFSKFMPFLWESTLLIPDSTAKIFYKIEGEEAVINLAGISPIRSFHDSLSLK
jgi:hypothetical protein